MIDPASEDGEVMIIRAISPLTHLSDYQRASVAFIVCIYSKNQGYFIKKFCVMFGKFLCNPYPMTVAESAFALSARRYFAFSSGESSSQCHLLFFVKYRFVSCNL